MPLKNLKKTIRSWERDGKHAWITRSVTFAYLQFWNLKDRFFIKDLVARLDAGTFPTDVHEAVRLVCEGDDGRGVRPMQVPEELEGLISLIKERKPRRLIEIGTARGGTLLLLCRFAAPDATIVSVDLPYGRNGGGYPKWKEDHYRSFALPGQTLHLVRADSHDPATVRHTKSLFDDAPVDFVLVDADHSYEGAKQDFETYKALAGENAIVAFHDILPNDEDPSIDVNRLWTEIETDASVRSAKIVHDEVQGHSGIGLVYV